MWGRKQLHYQPYHNNWTSIDMFAEINGWTKNKQAKARQMI